MKKGVRNRLCKRGHDRTLPGAILKHNTCRECQRLYSKKWQVSDQGARKVAAAAARYRKKKAGAVSGVGGTRDD